MVSKLSFVLVAGPVNGSFPSLYREAMVLTNDPPTPGRVHWEILPEGVGCPHNGKV